MRAAMETPEVTAAPPLAARLHILTADPVLAEAYTDLASRCGFAVAHATRAAQLLEAAEAGAFDAVLLDVGTQGEALLEVVRELRLRRPRAHIVIMSASSSVPTAVEAMKLGAFDYVVKPYGVEELTTLFERLASHLRMAGESRQLRDAARSRAGWGNLVGTSPEMEKLYRMISKAAYSVHPVLILGESGTGKELVARAIHYSGPHRDQPFIPVDCGSLVPTLIESELFGYVRGAFTGANHAKEGLLAIAQGGTVFLDEVAELPVELQAKLLRALQEKEIRPVGGTQPVKIDVRILAATNRDLELAVEAGHFRKDLFYRLNVLALRIPAAARAPPGHSPAGGALPGKADAGGHRGARGDRGSHADADAVRLAGQRARVGKLPGTRHRHEFRAGAACRRPGLASAQCAGGAGGGRAGVGQHRSHCGTGETRHPLHHRAAPRRQIAGGAHARHREDDVVSQAEGVRPWPVVRKANGGSRFGTLRPTGSTLSG